MQPTKENFKDNLAFVTLFLAATSLAVRGSGSVVGMGEFWKRSRETIQSPAMATGGADSCLVTYEKVWHWTVSSSQLEGEVGHLVNVWPLLRVWFEHVSWKQRLATDCNVSDWPLGGAAGQ